MAVRNRTIRGTVSSEHIVQFFDTDESRAQNVATFLAQGHALGEPLIVVARPANWTAILEHLDILGVPVQQAMAEGTLVVQDAADTLTPQPRRDAGRHLVREFGRQGRCRSGQQGPSARVR